VIPERLDASAVVAVASKLECPVVYVLATVHGFAAIFVSPEGKLHSLLLDSINSDITRALLYGAGEKPGYANGAMTGDASILRATLPDVLDVLRTGIMEPLSQYVTTLGHERAALIPIGSLGLLPLHAAIASLHLRAGEQTRAHLKDGIRHGRRHAGASQLARWEQPCSSTHPVRREGFSETTT
jgi:hypothetical protein